MKILPAQQRLRRAFYVNDRKGESGLYGEKY